MLSISETPDAGPVARQDEGFVLLAVLFMLLLVLISLSIAAPKVTTELRRDKEKETIHRGMQYARAIRIYYRKYGRYPNTIDQLINTDNQRFLRKRYLDPLTGKDDWRLIHLGEAQTMTNTIPGSTPIGSSGTNNGANGTAAAGSGSYSGLSFGSTGSSSSSAFGSSSSSGVGSPSSSAFGSSASSGIGSPSSSAFGSSASSGASPFGSSNSSSSPSSSGISFGNSGSTSSTGASGTGTTGGSAFGTPGATLGGAPIVGVGLPSTKASIKILKKQDHYNKWEFIYDPSQDLGGIMGQTGAGVAQQPGSNNSINGNSNGMGGPSTGFGNNGSSNGSGSSPTPAPAPTSPFGGSSPTVPQ